MALDVYLPKRSHGYKPVRSSAKTGEISGIHVNRSRERLEALNSL
jgi:hypothetical protein